MKDSVFTKIIKGEIPCYKIYEDDKTIAFLDIHPAQRGHALVVPKYQVDEFQNLPAADYQALWESVQKVAKRLKDVIKPPRIGVHVEGFLVPHAHVHVIPIHSGLRDFVPADSSNEPDHDSLNELANLLAF